VKAVACPVCGGSARRVFLEREGIPVFQNAPAASADEARSMPKGRLRLSVCVGCGFISNEAFDPALMTYGASYENDQTFSAVFDAHVAALVDELVASGVAGKRVVEVGCGTGYFLERLCAVGGNSGVGYDPAYKGESRRAGGSARFVPELFAAPSEPPGPDIIVSRHVIEHVQDPLAFLRGLRRALAAVASGRLFLETPAIEWILDRMVLQDFYYEHCSYFSGPTLRHAVEVAGFRVDRATTLFGGQYLWLEATVGEADEKVNARAAGKGLVEAGIRYGEDAADKVMRLRARLRDLRASGPVAVWGAGAKGVTLATLLDPGGDLIACMVDINPNKQGRFVPGTGHPIVAPRSLPGMGILHVLVMNPNYAEEIREEARKLAPELRIHVID